MIDGIRARFKNREMIKSFMLDNQEYFRFQETVGYIPEIDATEIIKQKGVAENMAVIITPQQAKLSNSIHKYSNLKNGYGRQNFNDFSMDDLVKAIDALEKDINVKAEGIQLTFLEFGMNIELDKPPRDLIDNNIYMYKYRNPSTDNGYRADERTKKFTVNNYEVKIYDKGLQNHLDKYLLRVEIKLKSSKLFNKLDIFTLNDLKMAESIHNLYNYFMERLDDVLIVDDWRDNMNVSDNDKEKLEMYLDNKYWLKLKDHVSSSTVNRRQKELKRIIDRNGLDKMKRDLMMRLRVKYAQLTQIEDRNIDDKFHPKKVG